MDQNCFTAQNIVTGGAISTSYFSQVQMGGLLYCLCMLSCFSHVRLFATLWTVAHQAPLSLVFSRQEYWSRLPCPPPGNLPDPEIEPMFPGSPALQKDSLPTESPGKPAVLLILWQTDPFPVFKPIWEHGMHSKLHPRDCKPKENIYSIIPCFLLLHMRVTECFATCLFPSYGYIYIYTYIYIYI